MGHYSGDNSRARAIEGYIWLKYENPSHFMLSFLKLDSKSERNLKDIMEKNSGGRLEFSFLGDNYAQYKSQSREGGKSLTKEDFDLLFYDYSFELYDSWNKEVETRYNKMCDTYNRLLLTLKPQSPFVECSLYDLRGNFVTLNTELTMLVTETTAKEMIDSKRNGIDKDNFLKKRYLEVIGEEIKKAHEENQHKLISQLKSYKQKKSN